MCSRKYCIVCYPVKGFIMSDTRNCKLQDLEGSQKSGVRLSYGVWGFSIGYIYIYSVCWFILRISKLTGYKGRVGNERGVGWFQEACNELSSAGLPGLLEV